MVDEVLKIISACLGFLTWGLIVYFVFLALNYYMKCVEEKDKYYNELDEDKQRLIDDYERQYRNVRFTWYISKRIIYKKPKYKEKNK